MSVHVAGFTGHSLELCPMQGTRRSEPDSSGGVGWEMLSSEQAFSSLEEGMPPLRPSVEDLACILHKCTKERDLPHALRLHAYARASGLESHTSLGNYLVSMLVDVGSMFHAQQVFGRLLYPNDCSWNSLIIGYAKCGESQHAFSLYHRMQGDDSLHPSGYTFVALLKACTMLKDLERGREIHVYISRKGLLQRNAFVGSTLIDMYVKCGSLDEGRKVFDKLPVRDLVSWTALIAGYVEHRCSEEALNCFEQMQGEGIFPDAFTVVCSLKACGSIGTLDKGREIHAKIVHKGLLERDIFIGSALIDMYAKCGSLVEAHEVFDKLPLHNVVSWTALITGYVEHGHGEEALHWFEQMQHEGISPGAVTFVCSLKSCGSIGAIDKGHETHADIAKQGLERELLIGNILVDMYAKCGSLVEAREVFDKLLVRNVVSCNALIAGYAEHKQGEEALKCLEQMQREDISPNAVTLLCSLKACGSIGAKVKGRKIHADIVRKGLLEGDVFISNTLVDMYAKCGLLSEAQEVFDKLLVRDVVSWTALITGYAEYGGGDEALNCFELMQHEGIPPGAVTFVCSLKACGSVGAAVRGQQIHGQIARMGLEGELLVGNTLVYMYAKCGLLATAEEVFDKLRVRDVISCNALIAGYAQLGESENILHIFDKMIGEGIKPDQVTFVCVLNACSHAGLVEKGQMYFEAMSKDYNFIPTLDHYTCMIDLLGRAGHIDKAVVMIKKMPFHPGIVVWHTVLGACRKWGNVELGQHAFEQAVRLDEKDDAAYVYMFNIYTDAAMQEEANKVEAMRVEKQTWKNPGHSWWTDGHKIVQSFLAEDRRLYESQQVISS